MAAMKQCRGFAAIFAEVAFSLSQVFSGITLTKFSGIVVLYFSKSQIFQVSFCSSFESFFLFFWGGGGSCGQSECVGVVPVSARKNRALSTEFVIAAVFIAS